LGIGPAPLQPAITLAAVDQMGDAAKAQWLGLPLSTEQQALLSQVTFQVEDLEGATLGLTQGVTVTVDANGAGYGWFVDPTPLDNAEFHFANGSHEWIANAGGPAADRVDLLTTLEHEIGHALGFQDVSAPNSTVVMTGTLPAGVRRTVSADHVLGDPSGERPYSPQASITSLEQTGGRFPFNIFAGLFNATGNGAPARPTDLSAPTATIDWADHDQHAEHPGVFIDVVKPKPSWLQRFLLHGDVEEHGRDAHDIEVVLRGRK
jgi:hypothetical protein